jgi:hypothetical protein
MIMMDLLLPCRSTLGDVIQHNKANKGSCKTEVSLLVGGWPSPPYFYLNNCMFDCLSALRIGIRNDIRVEGKIYACSGVW